MRDFGQVKLEKPVVEVYAVVQKEPVVVKKDAKKKVALVRRNLTIGAAEDEGEVKEIAQREEVQA